MEESSDGTSSLPSGFFQLLPLARFETASEEPVGLDACRYWRFVVGFLFFVIC
jgi:hypothetical protein